MESEALALLKQFLIDQCGIIVPVLLVLGLPLKYSKRVPDWAIVYILVAVGILLAIGILGVGVQAVLQGTLAAGGAVLLHQMWKQGQQIKTTKK